MFRALCNNTQRSWTQAHAYTHAPAVSHVHDVSILFRDKADIIDKHNGANNAYTDISLRAFHSLHEQTT